MKTKAYIITIILFLIPIITNAQSFKTEEGKAVFHSEVPLYSFSGESQFLVGLIDLDKGIVDFYLDLTTLDSGLGKRDRDMREVLETDKYPFAEFYGELISEFDTSLADTQNVQVKGTFTIHGVQQDLELQGKLLSKDNSVYLYADWILRLEDYDIVPPRLLFIKVDQEQKIEIEAEMKKVSK